MDNPLSCIVVCASLRILFSIILTSNFKHFIALRRYYHSVSFPSPNLFPTENNNRSFLGLQRSCTRTESVHLASSFFFAFYLPNEPMIQWDEIIYLFPPPFIGEERRNFFLLQCLFPLGLLPPDRQLHNSNNTLFFLLSRPKDLIYGFIPVAMVKNTRTGKKRGSDQFLFFPSHPRVLLLGARV